MLKYVQTQIPMPLYRKLRIEALDRDMGLGDLVQEILTNYSERKEKENGEEETKQRLVNPPADKDHSSRRRKG